VTNEESRRAKHSDNVHIRMCGKWYGTGAWACSEWAQTASNTKYNVFGLQGLESEIRTVGELHCASSGAC